MTCPNCNHYPGILTSPLDIGNTASGGGTAVYFWANSYVKSIIVTKKDGFCSPQPPSPYRDGAEVQFFCELGGQGHIGTVFYGHLQNIVQGTFNSNQKIVGYSVNNQCNCQCMSGPHVHMTRSSNGTTNSIACLSPVTRGSTWIYSWTAAC